MHRIAARLISTDLTPILVAAVCSISAPALGQIYGIKSNAQPSDPSSAPAVLFSFDNNGGSLTNHGTISVPGVGQVDADALAISSSHGTVAFRLEAEGSTLMHLDAATAVGTLVGARHDGRDIRGAAFDADDRLWAVDAARDEILEIDPQTGAVVGAPIGTHTTSDAVDVSTGADLALQITGQMWLVSNATFYTIDPATGMCDEAGADPTTPAQFFVGAAFAPTAGRDRMYVFEVNGSDDLQNVDASGNFTPTSLLPNILPQFNSGRGDLACLLVPCDVDLTFDGVLNTNDFFQFLTYYQAQDPRADFTGEGAINTNDFFAFLAVYQAGCP